MTEWGIDTLFNPGKRHMDEEKRRLQSTREEIGDSSGGRRIDLESGTVTISRSGKRAPDEVTDPPAADAGSVDGDSVDGNFVEGGSAEGGSAEAEVAERVEGDSAEGVEAAVGDSGPATDEFGMKPEHRSAANP